MRGRCGQNKAASQLEEAKAKKLAELRVYFKPDSEIMNTTIGKKTYEELRRLILEAQTLEDLNSIDIKAAYDEAWGAYQEFLKEQERLRYEAQLNKTKQEKIHLLELQFQSLLSRPLPQDLKDRTIQVLTDLKEQIMEATSFEEVNSTNPDPYLLELWRDYYLYLIDIVPSKSVVLERNNVKRIVSKDDAKAILAGILDYRELMKYRVYKVEYVDIALVLSRDKINGAFLSPGDKVILFAMNKTTKTFREIANDGYIQLILLPKEAGVITVSESQSQSSTSQTASSTQNSEQRQVEYQPGSGSITSSQRSGFTSSSTQSYSETSSATYSYNVNLAEILKAVAAGKIKAPEDVKDQLSAYGWEIVDLERTSGMLVLEPNSRFLVILKVPSIFVPEILSHKDSIYIAKVST